MADHLQQLVASVLRDPAMPIGRLQLLSAAERQEVLGMRVPPPICPQRGETLVGLFERQAALTSGRVAVVFPKTIEEVPGSRQSMSYAELNVCANRLAHRLRRSGVGPNVLVALYLPKSLDLIAGILGVLKAGGAYLPLDPVHPLERSVFMVNDAKSAVVLTHQELAKAFVEAHVPTVCLDRVDPGFTAEPADNPLPIAGQDDLAYVIYTSGSTGGPKGVAVKHRNVVRLFTASENSLPNSTSETCGRCFTPAHSIFRYGNCGGLCFTADGW